MVVRLPRIPEGWQLPALAIPLRLAPCRRCSVEVLYAISADGFHGIRYDRDGELHLGRCPGVVTREVKGL